MNTRCRLAIGSFAAFSLLSAVAVPAYNVGTHRAISVAALRHTEAKVDDFLKKELFLPKGLDTPASGSTFEQLVARGAEEEDGTSIFQGPYLRHFYNPITDRGLNNGQFENSLMWAWSQGGTLGGPHMTWRDARRHYFNWLKTGSAGSRRDTFLALGHVIHLIQDAAQPQHTRDDAHPGSPYEAYCDRFGTPAAVNALGVESIPSLGQAPLDANETAARMSPTFKAFFDTEQYQGQTFTPGGGLGLAEYSNYFFVTDDTMFTADLAGGSTTFANGLKAYLDPFAANHSQYFPYPRLADTSIANLGTLYPGLMAEGIDLIREGEDISTSLGRPVDYWGLNVPGGTDNLFTTSYLTILPFITTNVQMGLTDPNYQAHATKLLPKAVSYSAGIINYFFRGKLDTHLTWDRVNSRYNLRITNLSDDALGAGTWKLSQDSARTNDGTRTILPLSINYGGSLASGASIDATFKPAALRGPLTIIFQGTIGDEQEIAVAAKTFQVVRVNITWEPESDQDLYMWGPDGSLIAYYNRQTSFGELDNDNIGGVGPENITLSNITLSNTDSPGRYQFMINYYRDWTKEATYNPDTGEITVNDPPLNAPDDPGDPAFTQTTVQVKVETYLNSSAPVHVATRTMTFPNYGSSVPPAGLHGGAVGDSWFVTMIIIVEPNGTVRYGDR